MIMMDEVWLTLCLGPMNTEEEFINTYMCHLTVCVCTGMREIVA